MTFPTARSRSLPERLRWKFNDSSEANVSGATPTHEYESWGTYMVTLTVTDAGGLSTTRTTTATIAPPGHLKSR